AFMPRFLTALHWAQSMPPAEHNSPESIRFDAARDGLAARALLDGAGLGAQAPALAFRLVTAAHEIARRVAALPLAERASWGEEARLAVGLGLEGGALALEAALARIALEWALASDYVTDRLWYAVDGAQAPDALIVLEGPSPEPLARALVQHLGARAALLSLSETPPAASVPTAHALRFSLHKTLDTEDEAECSAACVLQHLHAGRTPVALAATDRLLTRRVRALLESRGVTMHDETGWALSTSRAAAQVMGVLRAAGTTATTDVVLDWLKNAPAFASSDVAPLERALRRAGAAQWQSWCAMAPHGADGPAALTERAERLRGTLTQPRPLGGWLAALRAALLECGQWDALDADPAGRQVLATLQLDEPDVQAACALRLSGTSWAQQRLTLGEFRRWVADGLEHARFVPEAPDAARVVILPLAQLFARPFAALVLPGCDERHLNAAPEPDTAFGTAQREALGLVTREQLAQAQAAAWQHAMAAAPVTDLLWRASDGGGEPLVPSPLLQRWLLADSTQGPAAAADPRTPRTMATAPVRPSRARAPALALEKISASAYESLRQCPYQFFALRQLGLGEADEIEVEVGKRDFGNWLHHLLKLFHEAMQAAPVAAGEARLAAIDAAAQRASIELGLAEHEFLPFAASWPQLRDGYLAWLAREEHAGTRFEAAELACEQRYGDIVLSGRIDRLDRLADGRALLIDYKTEAPERTRKRIKQLGEDTQLAFYGALLADDTVAALYLNVGEKGTVPHEQQDMVELRDALVAGLTHDLHRIAAGAELPPMGAGSACDWCAARGLCRRDSW
ncbi:MAG: PD-(D/E)XK nuclease family protein, partial [Burkholderiales bacterium]